jgi:para-nitrobenzyl esterase
VSSPIAATTSGPVRGTEREGIQVFRGIPYAGSPAGARRFLAPEPPAPWTELRDATTFGLMAPQPSSPMETLLGGPPPEYDEAGCLTLNVYTPGVDDRRRPVMVWIHGGAFIGGTAATPWYNGRHLATEGDVVIVTINYRLGSLGFLHLAEVGGERYASSGNTGLLDQIAALRWVRDNIAAFGGDPQQVTIFGESAGGSSVSMLLGMPEARGLFHRAIAQSGTAAWAATREQAAGVTESYLAELGLRAAPSSLDALLERPVADLMAAQLNISTRYGIGRDFRPVIDGVAVPRHPFAAVRDGAVAGVDLMVGTTRHEMNLFALGDPTIATRDGLIAQRFGTDIGREAAEMVEVYERNGRSERDAFLALATDGVFRIPAIRLAEAQREAGGRAHMYLFTFETPVFGGQLRSTHALEIPFVFGTYDARGAVLFTGDGPGRAALSDQMRAAWLSFAKTGDPGWSQYDPADGRATRVFGPGGGVVSDPDGDERELWEGVI